MSAYSLPNTERLKSAKIIQHLFADGESFSVYPIRVVFLPTLLPTHTNHSIQIAFSVGKRKFPKAVSRNRLKRQMREAYRLQKSGLLEALSTQEAPGLAVIFLYIGNEPLSYKRISGAMRKILKKLSAKNWNTAIDNQPKG